MAGIASVGILPEHRGSGSAIAMMRSAVQELSTQNVAISVLYPAVQRLYRNAGYAQGGVRCGWNIRTERIRLNERSLPIVSMPVDLDLLEPIYAQYAPSQNGSCDRHHSIWLQKICTKADEPIYAYRVGAEAQPQGYIVFTQNRENGQGTLTIRDWTAITVDAAQTLWAFLAAHRSQVDVVRWHGDSVNAMLALLPEQSAQMTHQMIWMLRIINLPLALESRGYPPSVNADLHLRVVDDVLSANSGAFVLSVQHGVGTVSPGGRGDMAIAIQGLAPLYTGLYTSHQLRWMGWLEGTDESVAIAAQLFAGSSPWMADFF